LILAVRFVLEGPGKRSAVADARALAAAVAIHVDGHADLPRVRVSIREGFEGEALWGEVFLVEQAEVPRADPERARTFFLVGTPEHWCVEMQYQPDARFSFFESPSAWVSVMGVGGTTARVGDGRCGSGFVLHLSPPSAAEAPPPGSIVLAATLPTGTCVSGWELETALVYETGSVEVIDCAQEHHGEVYHSAPHTTDTFNGDALWREAASQCGQAFRPYVGVPNNLSALNELVFVPTEAQWDAGSRAFSCIAFLGSEHYPIVGSVRDSWR